MKLNEFTPSANDKKHGVRVGHVQIFVMRVVVVDRMRESGSSSSWKALEESLLPRYKDEGLARMTIGKFYAGA